ncbi:MAG: Site-specific DNA-methyltransferase (adenine-specific) [Deltaproteobacteria bacterium]|nr:Site-specific DNA-methyltransferase (adenine-specific) [Deltaproteobacteria bacterium]
MPTLNWIGRKAVENHHRQVPFHLLKEVPELSVGDPGSGNLLVEGDNLLALKALLPYYAGHVKCIYIDPPYNTGDENWIYDDNVNTPDIGNGWARQEQAARRNRGMRPVAIAAARGEFAGLGVVVILFDSFLL